MKFWNWKRFALASHKSTNTSVTENVVILCETNNIFTHSSTDIADCVVKIGYCLREKFSNINVFIHGLIPRDRSWSVNKVLIKDVNNNDLSLFLRDSLHLFN